MILDSVDNIERYFGLSPLMDQALRFLMSNDLSEMDEQRIDIQGDDVYVMIQHYDTENGGGRSYETHDKYIDIQYIISGAETILYARRKSLSIEKAYDPEGDCTLYYCDATVASVSLEMENSDFAVFYPADAHVPKLQTGDMPAAVRKAVFKVKVP